MSENIPYSYSSPNYERNYYDQFILSYCPIYSQQPPISIAPYSYHTTLPFSTSSPYAYHNYQGFIPYTYFFDFDSYNCVPLHPADALRLARQSAQDFADYLCKKYNKSEVNNKNLPDLPDDIIANILRRLDTFEILVNAQRVCKAWRKICEDPSMWRVICMENLGCQLRVEKRKELQRICREAIDRSQGQLVEIRIQHIASDMLFTYLAQNKRSSQLRRLEIAWSHIRDLHSWSDLFQNSPLLEHISLTYTDIGKQIVSIASRYCPKLESFGYHEIYTMKSGYRPSEITHDEDDFVITIAKCMPQLRHLELVGSEMTNTGLQAILDGCTHLVSLNLRQCFNINLNSSCGMLCRERIKDMRLPYDPDGRT